MNGTHEYYELIGNLGKDPEIRYTKIGQVVVTLTIAVNYRIKGQEPYYTEWRYVKIFGQAAEIAALAKKGTKVLVTPRLRTKTWVDKVTGEKRRTLQMISPVFKFMSSKKLETGSISYEEIQSEEEFLGDV